MKELIIDALLDTLKLIPYLFITFLILEFIEHKLSKKTEKTLGKYKKVGPLLGGLLGGFPQCGFSAMASNLYVGNVITKGTLIAIFLSTSDEMLPIMLSESISPFLIIRIVLLKIIIGIIIGLLVDLIIRPKSDSSHIEDMCDNEHCHCNKGVLLSSIIHTLKTTLFILIANILIGIILFYVGEDNLSSLLNSNNFLVYFGSSLIGLIPNCAASVILTEVYLKGVISLGTALSGLLTGSGLGILLLFKSNKSLKDNLTILSIIYFVGVVCGLIIDIIV